MGKSKDRITAEEFVRTWQAASSLSEVSEKLNMDRRYCSVRASYFRNRGVDLKRFESGFGPGGLNVGKLNEIAKASGTSSGTSSKTKRKPVRKTPAKKASSPAKGGSDKPKEKPQDKAKPDPQEKPKEETEKPSPK